MKTYKTIIDFGLGNLFIEHFNTLEAATAAYKDAIEHEAETVYLLEEKVHWQATEDSTNIILSTYRKNI